MLVKTAEKTNNPATVAETFILHRRRQTDKATHGALEGGSDAQIRRQPVGPRVVTGGGKPWYCALAHNRRERYGRPGCEGFCCEFDGR